MAGWVAGWLGEWLTGSEWPLRSPSKNHVKYYPRSMTFELFLPDLDQSILNALGGWLGGWLAGWLGGWLGGWLAGWVNGWLAQSGHKNK